MGRPGVAPRGGSLAKYRCARNIKNQKGVSRKYFQKVGVLTNLNMMKFVSLFFSLVLMLLFIYVPTATIHTQSFDGKYYRLTTKLQGDDKSLDIVNDGKNDKLQLAKTGNFGGQVWKITPLGDGEYRLTSQWQVLSGVLNTFAYTRTICAPIAFKRVSIC